jgi:hypothetical protein
MPRWDRSASTDADSQARPDSSLSQERAARKVACRGASASRPCHGGRRRRAPRRPGPPRPLGQHRPGPPQRTGRLHPLPSRDRSPRSPQPSCAPTLPPWPGRRPPPGPVARRRCHPCWPGAYRAELIDADPMTRLDRTGIPASLPRPMPAGHLDAVLQAIPRHKDRDRLQFTLLYTTGTAHRRGPGDRRRRSRLDPRR